jgi:GntR family transcriptional regulator / MocR family aminotransferase
VPAVLPEALLTTRRTAASPVADAPPPRLAARAVPSAAAASDIRHPGRPFDPSAPDSAAFPFEPWARLLARAWRRPAPALLHARDPGGLPALRRAIAEHLTLARGLDCTAEQVIVTSGLRETLELLARALADPGAAAWVEEPGYPAARRVLEGMGVCVVPVPVDGEGLSVAEGTVRAPGARLALVTPSRHFPLGTTMSLARRLALIEWAAEAEAWIVEDDYDSEYRYAGRPLAALMSLDRRGRVIYVGSFSKVLFRTLRLAYVVAPPTLASALLAAQATLGTQASLTPQPALAELMASGRFAAHIRRTRRLYAERRRALLSAIEADLGDLLDVAPDEAGMHVVARPTPALAARMDDRTAAARAATAGVTAPPLSAHYAGTPTDQGLLLGFACAGPDALRAAARRLGAALRA